MTKKNNSVVIPLTFPATQQSKCAQYDIFSKYVTNDLSEVSNTIEYWERIPKYFLTKDQQKRLRLDNGLANTYAYEYSLKNKLGQEKRYKVTIQPAQIVQEDGIERAFFPSQNEECIEEVLKKIFSEQGHGVHDAKNLESWVRFSYGQIRKELYRMKRGLRYDQIKHSLTVMSKCNITVYEDNKQIFTGSILQDYYSVDRDTYRSDSEAFHYARLPALISKAVNDLKFRQFNYVNFMRCNEQLTRFIYKRLINRFTNANYINDYHFMFSDIKQSSGLLQQSRDNDNRRKVVEALKELISNKVISDYNKEERKEGKKVIDVKYIIKPHPNFVADQKAANKRAGMLTTERTK